MANEITELMIRSLFRAGWILEGHRFSNWSHRYDQKVRQDKIPRGTDCYCAFGLVGYGLADMFVLAFVISPSDPITGSEQGRVCGYLAVCRILGLTRMCPFLEVGADCYNPGHHAVTVR